MSSEPKRVLITGAAGDALAYPAIHALSKQLELCTLVKLTSSLKTCSSFPNMLLSVEVPTVNFSLMQRLLGLLGLLGGMYADMPEWPYLQDKLAMPYALK